MGSASGIWWVADNARFHGVGCNIDCGAADGACRAFGRANKSRQSFGAGVVGQLFHLVDILSMLVSVGGFVISARVGGLIDS
ncbi:Uncharacterised protein [Mycobacteroides abscessus subsp. abscessus]|nr:Uncharacterised protein [Mycobacteroides abscessus subsp. abscessus]